MERLISSAESIICDLSFTGLNEVPAEILLRIKNIQAACHELNMPHGETLCVNLINEISDGNSVSAVRALCCFACYIQCISNMNEAE